MFGRPAFFSKSLELFGSVTANFSFSVHLKTLLSPLANSAVHGVVKTDTGTAFLLTPLVEEAPGAVVLQLSADRKSIVFSKKGLGDMVKAPNLYHIEPILSGTPTGFPEGCIKEAGSESPISSLFFPSDDGLTIVDMTADGDIRAHSSLFLGDHIENISLFQKEGTCSALIIGRRQEISENGELVWRRVFYVNRSSLSVLSAGSVKESDFFAVLEGDFAFDGVRFSYFVSHEDRKTLLRLDNETGEIGIVASVPSERDILFLHSLSYGVVLVVKQTGSYLLMPDGLVQELLRSQIDFSHFSKIGHVFLPDSEEKSDKEESIFIFYPKESIKIAKEQKILGGYILKMAKNSQGDLSTHIEHIFSDKVILDYIDDSSLLSVASFSDIKDDGKTFSSLQKYFLSPQTGYQEQPGLAHLRQDSSALFAAYEVLDFVQAPHPSLSQFFYSDSYGNLIRYRPDKESFTFLASDFLEDRENKKISLFSLWDPGLVVLSRGSRLRLKDSDGYPVKIIDLNGNPVSEFDFFSRILCLKSVRAGTGSVNGNLIFSDVIVVATENNGVWFLAPKVGFDGHVLKDTYFATVHLFDGFNFSDITFADDGSIILHDQDYGRFASIEFDFKRQSIHDIGEEHFQSLEN